MQSRLTDSLKVEKKVKGNPRIPVLDDDGKTICTVNFVDNLTKQDVPDYVNMNCLIGLVKYPGIRFMGYYVLCYYDKYYPSRSYGEIISPEEAYNICNRNGRYDLIALLDIEVPEREREVL